MPEMAASRRRPSPKLYWMPCPVELNVLELVARIGRTADGNARERWRIEAVRPRGRLLDHAIYARRQTLEPVIADAVRGRRADHGARRVEQIQLDIRDRTFSRVENPVIIGVVIDIAAQFRRQLLAKS